MQSSRGGRLVVTPSLTCSAPARANLIGNPTDIYGGAVLSCSVDLRARVRVEGASGLQLATGGDECEVRCHEDLERRGDALDLGRVVLAAVGIEGLEAQIRYDTEIPRQSGMGGSSALLVSLLQALRAFRGAPLGRYELAESARAIELELMKVVCGYVDQYMCTFGGLRHLDFRGKQLARPEGEELYATVERLSSEIEELPFVLAYTGVQHLSGAVHSPIRERWLAGDPEVVEGYERVTHLAGLGKRAFLARDWARFGALMNENHEIQRGFGGSGESNERLIAAALGAGALGAKLAGAGDGGTIVALCNDHDRPSVEAALREAGAAALYRPTIVPGVTLDAA
jgi:galactokinase/mevalonate kinase-like predicted kinase